MGGRMGEPNDPNEPPEPTTQMVPNPAYTALKSLHDDVVAAQQSLSTALKAAADQMHNGTAWTGPTAAKAWTEEVSGRDQRLPGLVTQILHAVEDEMAATPHEVERPINRGLLM